jgi:hypothetical protein
MSLLARVVGERVRNIVEYTLYLKKGPRYPVIIIA